MDKTIFWQKHVVDGLPSFVGMVRVRTNKMASTFNSNATVAYPAHLVLLSIFKKPRRFFIDYGHTLIALLLVDTLETRTDGKDKDAALKQLYLPLYAIESHPDELPGANSKRARDMKLKVLYRTMHKILSFLNDIA